MLRSRTRRREDPLDVHVPDPVVSTGDDPAEQAMLADAVGLALQVVLESLDPAERLALVLHDMFAVPFDAIAPIVGRSPAATRQLASRARRRVRNEALAPERDLAKQRQVVDAWLAASGRGDFDALVALLDPDAVLRVDGGVGASGLSKLVRGAAQIAGNAMMFRRGAPTARAVLVNGTVGLMSASARCVTSIMSFTIVDGRIHRLDILADPDRLAARTAEPAARARSRWSGWARSIESRGARRCQRWVPGTTRVAPPGSGTSTRATIATATRGPSRGGRPAKSACSAWAPNPGYGARRPMAPRCGSGPDNSSTAGARVCHRSSTAGPRRSSACRVPLGLCCPVRPSASCTATRTPASAAGSRRPPSSV